MTFIAFSAFFTDPAHTSVTQPPRCLTLSSFQWHHGPLHVADHTLRQILFLASLAVMAFIACMAFITVFLAFMAFIAITAFLAFLAFMAFIAWMAFVAITAK